MKFLLKYFLFFLFAAILTSCTSEKNVAKPMFIDLSDSKDFVMELNPGPGYNHPSFAIWIEDMNGDYVKTLFITKSYASGIFGYKILGDSVWVNESGESIQPAALPYWTHKKGLINDKTLVPSPENPFVDAYTGVTPKGKFTLSNAAFDVAKYRVLLEVNQPWDWNKFWTNNKFPDSRAYSHSAQPSVVYAVTINATDSEFYLNLIGHGSPTGETGKLYTDLSTLSTALDIFSSIKITINK